MHVKTEEERPQAQLVHLLYNDTELHFKAGFMQTRESQRHVGEEGS